MAIIKRKGKLLIKAQGQSNFPSLEASKPRPTKIIWYTVDKATGECTGESDTYEGIQALKLPSERIVKYAYSEAQRTKESRRRREAFRSGQFNVQELDNL